MKKMIVATLAVGIISAAAFYFLNSRDHKANKTVAEPGINQPVEKINRGHQLLSVDTENPDVAGSQRRLWVELPFALVKSRAEQGDAEAQWYLSEMYGYCFSYNMKREGVLDHFDHIQRSKPKAKNHIKRILSDLAERCPTVEGGQPIPNEAITLWMEQSAKHGNLIAQLRQATLADNVEPQTLLAYVDQVKKSNSPRAVFEMGTLSRLIEPHWKDEKTAIAFSKGKYATHAWELAACRSGLDCSQSSSIMYWACFQGGCGYDNYEQYVMNELVTPAGRRQLEESIQLIQENFLK